MHRRSALAAFSGIAALMAPSWARPAQFPSKPIRLIVPYAPGGASDLLARAVAESMTKTFGQPVVVQNKPGASGTTGSEMVARSAPDGYTIVMGTSASHSLNTVVFANSYDPVTAFTPIALVTRVPNLVFVPSSSEATDLASLVRYLKANPGTGVAVGGPATSGRFAAELMVAKLRVELNVVPYQGSTPAMTDVLAGHVKLGITDLLSPMPFISNKELRPIALTGLKRAPVLPDVPTIAEKMVPGFDAVAWNALFAPPGTPADVVERLNAATRKTFESEEVRSRFEALGQEVAVGSPEELRNFVANDVARWKEVANANKLTF